MIGAGCDVLVVGSGLAGLTAARRAQERGARVTLVERTAEAPGWNNSRIASGIFHIGLRHPQADAEQLLQHIDTITSGTARIPLARALVEAAPHALAWLEGQGVALTSWSDAALPATAPLGIAREGLAWRGLGMDQCLQRLWQPFTDRGGAYHAETRAAALLHGPGHIAGARLETAAGESMDMTARAVILADGGFQGNEQMLRRYVTPTPERLLLRAADSATGDGIAMGLAAGAKCVGMSNFYGHCLHRESVDDERLWPYPVLDSLMAAGIVVDRAGMRVFDEGQGGVFMSNALARRDDPQDTWVIFDSAIWDGPGAQAIGNPPNPTLRELEATIWQAETLEALAHAIGVDNAGLLETVGDYNAALAAASSEHLPVPRSGDKQKPYPINRPPYLALPIVPGITHTMGGLLISPRAEVLDEAEQPLAGLYAAGATAGGLDGGPRAGYLGGLMEALAFGLIAGEAATQFAARGEPSRAEGTVR